MRKQSFRLNGIEKVDFKRNYLPLRYERLLRGNLTTKFGVESIKGRLFEFWKFVDWRKNRVLEFKIRRFDKLSQEIMNKLAKNVEKFISSEIGFNIF